MDFELLILGSNSALPYKDRFPSAQVLYHNDDLFLIDCGEGTQIRISKEHVKRSKFKAVFISHLHGDHVFGLPGLLTSFSLNGRKDPLIIHGPTGIADMINTVLRYSGSVLSYELSFREIDTTHLEKIYETPHLKVSAFPLKHRIMTYGYRFEEHSKDRHILPDQIAAYDIPFDKIPSIKKGMDYILPNGQMISNSLLTSDPDECKVYAYCSDTIYDESIISYIAGADLLYHESTFLHNLAAKARERMHSTAKEAALIAKKAQVKKLVLGHYSSRYSDLTPFQEEAAAIFEAAFLAVEGKRFSI